MLRPLLVVTENRSNVFPLIDACHEKIDLFMVQNLVSFWPSNYCKISYTWTIAEDLVSK